MDPEFYSAMKWLAVILLLFIVWMAMRRRRAK
jgi:hypothetical protein